MKRALAYVAFFVVLGSVNSGCRKEFKCDCYDSQGNYQELTVTADSRKEARAACQALGDSEWICNIPRWPAG
jgi:hypothetical protein